MSIITPEMVQPVFKDPLIVWKEPHLQALFNTEPNIPYPDTVRTRHVGDLRGLYFSETNEIAPTSDIEFAHLISDPERTPFDTSSSVYNGSFVSIKGTFPVAENSSEARLRLYFNPGIADTIPLFMGLHKVSQEKLGELAEAKFRFEGMSDSPHRRSHMDRVVAYPTSMRQARAMLHFAAEFTPSDPGPSIPFAHPIEIDGEQFDWIAVGEEPNNRTKMGADPASLTQSRIRMLMKAVDRFPKVNVMTDKRPNCTEEELEAELTHMALANGVHSASMSFNAGTNLGDVQAALGIKLLDREVI